MQAFCACEQYNCLTRGQGWFDARRENFLILFVKESKTFLARFRTANPSYKFVSNFLVTARCSCPPLDYSAHFLVVPGQSRAATRKFASTSNSLEIHPIGQKSLAMVQGCKSPKLFAGGQHASGFARVLPGVNLMSRPGRTLRGCPKRSLETEKLVPALCCTIPRCDELSRLSLIALQVQHTLVVITQARPPTFFSDILEVGTFAEAKCEKYSHQEEQKCAPHTVQTVRKVC